MTTDQGFTAGQRRSPGPDAAPFTATGPLPVALPRTPETGKNP